MPLKVIGAGYGRTGTNSLRLALEALGYRTHHMIRAMSDMTQDYGVWERAANDPNHPDEWESVYGNYDAAVDWPTVSHYQELMQRYPDAKIILTVRSAESWYKSMSNTVFKKLVSSGLDTFPEHAKTLLQSQTNIMLNGYFKEGIEKCNNKEELCMIYDEHTKEVKQVVPPERLLVLELGEGWERLCEFLQVPIPEIPYPNTNGASEDFEKNAKLVISELERQTREAQKVKVA
ncbi:P-loop containing nucleoside triphosphate hydrolase protein [Phycomyces nitens]|nr:P-loop containing nucleoside triphosphate hydrolase protein [Phycomyces nitens]